MNRLAFSILSAPEVRAMNALAGTRRALGFTAGGVKWSLDFHAMLPAFAPTWNLSVTLGGKPCAVELERLPDVAQISPDFAGVKLEEVPPETWLAVLETALQDWLDAAERALQISIAIEQITEQSANANAAENRQNANRIFFEIARDGQPMFLRGRFTLDAEIFQRIAQLAEQAPAHLDAGDGFHLLPFRGQIVIGETDLSVREFERIERGDIVLLDHHGLAGDATRCAVVFSPQLRFSARLKNGKSVFSTDKTMADAAIPTPAKTTDAAAVPAKTPAPASAPTPTPAAKPVPAVPAAAQAAKAAPTAVAAAAKPSLENLPVHLVFAVGEKEITLEELKRLEPGFTFELDQTAERPVTIQANGKAIGIGELVEIGERIGVRVLEWSGSVSTASAPASAQS